MGQKETTAQCGGRMLFRWFVKDSKIKFADRLIWSVLVFRLKFGKGCSESEIVRRTRLSRKGVRTSIKRLLARHLIEIASNTTHSKTIKDKNGQLKQITAQSPIYRAKQPPDGLIYSKKSDKPEWWTRLAFYRCKIVADPKADILFGVLWRLVNRKKNPKPRQTAAGLGSIIGLTAPAVAQALNRLVKTKRISLDKSPVNYKGVTFTVHILASEPSGVKAEPSQIMTSLNAAKIYGSQADQLIELQQQTNTPDNEMPSKIEEFVGKTYLGNCFGLLRNWLRQKLDTDYRTIREVKRNADVQASIHQSDMIAEHRTAEEQEWTAKALKNAAVTKLLAPAYVSWIGAEAAVHEFGADFCEAYMRTNPHPIMQKSSVGFREELRRFNPRTHKSCQIIEEKENTLIIKSNLDDIDDNELS